MRTSSVLPVLAVGFLLQVNLPASQFTFETRAYSAIDTPEGIASGDLNADGLPDLVVTAHSPERLEWWLNDATGNFHLGGTLLLPAGSDPRKVVLTDVDGDGQLDAGILLVGTNQLQLAMGQVGGSFVLGSVFATGLFPIDIAAADADGDGDNDFLVATQDDDTATLFSNDGAGVFTGSGFAVGNAPFGVTFGDFDGDSDLDFAVSNRLDQTISVFENQGLGVFSAWSTIVGNVDFYDIVAADLDGDLDDDLAVVANDMMFIAAAAIFLSDGVGGWSGQTNWPIPVKGPEQIVAADLDCDGDIDLALGIVPTNTPGFATLENDGSGAFPVTERRGQGTNIACMIADDFDQDGAADLAMVARDSDEFLVSLTKTCGLEIDRNGHCGVMNDFVFSGATPFGLIFVLISLDRGIFTIPVNKPCAGTTLALDAVGLRLALTVVADQNGVAHVSRFAGAHSCGMWMQIVDATTCNVSNLSHSFLREVRARLSRRVHPRWLSRPLSGPGSGC